MTTSDLPVLDFGDLDAGPESTRRFREGLRRATHEVAFFHLRHRIPPSVIDELFDVTRRLVALDEDAKLSVEMTRSPWFRGPRALASSCLRSWRRALAGDPGGGARGWPRPTARTCSRHGCGRIPTWPRSSTPTAWRVRSGPHARLTPRWLAGRSHTTREGFDHEYTTRTGGRRRRGGHRADRGSHGGPVGVSADADELLVGRGVQAGVDSTRSCATVTLYDSTIKRRLHLGRSAHYRRVAGDTSNIWFGSTRIPS